MPGGDRAELVEVGCAGTGSAFKAGVLSRNRSWPRLQLPQTVGPRCDDGLLVGEVGRRPRDQAPTSPAVKVLRRGTRVNDMRRRNSPQLAFNFMPVSFSAEKFEGGLVPFESPDQLNDLRAELDGTHVVSKTRGASPASRWLLTSTCPAHRPRSRRVSTSGSRCAWCRGRCCGRCSTGVTSYVGLAGRRSCPGCPVKISSNRWYEDDDRVLWASSMSNPSTCWTAGSPVRRTTLA
jgi:hypothetical protein